MSKFEIYHNYLNYLLLLHSPNEHKYISDVMILSLKENIFRLGPANSYNG